MSAYGIILRETVPVTKHENVYLLKYVIMWLIQRLKLVGAVPKYGGGKNKIKKTITKFSFLL